MILNVISLRRTLNKVCTINELWRKLQCIDQYFGNIKIGFVILDAYSTYIVKWCILFIF